MATAFSLPGGRLGRRRNSGPAVLMSLKLKNSLSCKFSFIPSGDTPQIEDDEEETLHEPMVNL